MDEKQKNKSSEPKKSSTIGQVKNAAKKLGAGKAVKKVLLNVVIFLLPIILLGLLFYSVISLVADFFSGIAENIADFFSLDSTGGIIITDESIDKIIEAMKNDLNISPEDLNLLGDIDYNDPNQEEAIKEAERKYIRLFLEAQETTQSINDGGFFGTGLGSEGSVYIKKVRNGATDTNDLSDMSPISMEDLQRKIDNGASDVWNYFSINGSGQLVVPVMNNGTINTTTIDYKSMISQYSTPWNFFIDLEMVVQNPKFMEAFVDLVKDSKINLTIVYNTTYTKETIVHEYKVTETIKDENGNDIEIETTKTDTTVNEYENRNPMLVITTADTWVYSRESVYKATTTTTTEGPIVEGNADDKTTTTIETTTTTYSQEGATKEEYNGGQKGEDGTFVGLLDKSFKIPNSQRTAKAGDSLVSGAEMLFELLESSSNTAPWSDIMRYILYVYTGKDYGVTEFNFSLFATNTFQSMGMTNLSTYLRQFSHSGEAPQSADGKYYLMYGDGSGWPTIGNADIQWKSHHGKFAVEGEVLQNGTAVTVPNVEEYVNGILGSGAEAQYSDSEIEQKQIYVEKELVDSIGDKMRKTFYTSVENVTRGLNLSQQQMYALTAIAYNFGSLPERNGYTFKEVYEAGAAQYEINSWQHTKFIWDNWWSYLGGMTAQGGRSALVEARDGAYETYVKGIYDLSQSRGGAIFGRTCYVFYTQSQISRYSYARSLPYTRTSSNEEELFTYEEKSGGNYEEATGEYGVIGYYTNSMGRRFTILNQSAISGWGDKCNRAACAIIASGYSDQDSTQLINIRNNAGSAYFGAIPSDSYWNQYGLTVTPCQDPGYNYQQSLENQLISGGYAMVWLNNGGTYYGKSGIKWTSLYHWVAIIDIKEENGVKQMCVADWRGISWVGIDEFSTHGVTHMVFVNEK